MVYNRMSPTGKTATKAVAQFQLTAVDIEQAFAPKHWLQQRGDIKNKQILFD